MFKYVLVSKISLNYNCVVELSKSIKENVSNFFICLNFDIALCKLILVSKAT